MEADPKSSGFSFDVDAAISSMENIGVFVSGLHLFLKGKCV